MLPLLMLWTGAPGDRQMFAKTIVGFEHTEQFLADLKARFARFGLNLHPDKRRLIEFGRSAIANRRTLARNCVCSRRKSWSSIGASCAWHRSNETSKRLDEIPGFSLCGCQRDSHTYRGT